jgi:hypothetical protein
MTGSTWNNPRTESRSDADARPASVPSTTCGPIPMSTMRAVMIPFSTLSGERIPGNPTGTTNGRCATNSPLLTYAFPSVYRGSHNA